MKGLSVPRFLMSIFSRTWLFLLWSFAVGVWPAVATAQALGPSLDSSLPLRKYVIDTWQAGEGLPNATIEAILQTRDGYCRAGGTVPRTLQHGKAPFLVLSGTSDAEQRLRAWQVSFRPRVPSEVPKYSSIDGG